ncbi:MAG: ferritin-like domain-containing protein [Nitrososphaeraceae archaeon]
MADAAHIHAKEVFDSSKYNAMSDMTKASNRETKNVETLPDTKRITNSVNPEQIDDDYNNNNNNKSITTTAATASSSGVEEEIITPKMTPMMVEERARTIREVKEEETHQHLSPSTSSSSSSSVSYQTGKEKKFVLYLNIMLSIENAAIERLHARIQQSPLVEVREQLVQHLEETREQKSRLITLINRLGGEPTNERSDLFGYSLPKVLADAFKASATTPEEQELRTMEADALIEHAEVIGYNMAIQLATKINIGEAIMPLRQNLQEEEKMVAWMRANLPSNFVQLWSKIDDEQRSQ